MAKAKDGESMEIMDSEKAHEDDKTKQSSNIVSTL